MRKVNSAPSLVDLGNKTSSDTWTGGRLSAKSNSSAAISRLGGCHVKEDGRRQNSNPPRTQPLRALYYDLPHHAPASDEILPEEFAESAKGLAGLDCLELYGASEKAPALAVEASSTGMAAQYQSQESDDGNAYALAACLNTPYTAQEKNLGELVGAAARNEAQAAIARLEAKYEREVSSQLKEHVGVLEQEREEDLLRTGLLSRRRRLVDFLGLLKREGYGGEGLSEDDRSDIAHLLMTSLDDEGVNRWEMPEEWKDMPLEALAKRRVLTRDIDRSSYLPQNFGVQHQSWKAHNNSAAETSIAVSSGGDMSLTMTP